jgi:hypothetical protein
MWTIGFSVVAPVPQTWQEFGELEVELGMAAPSADLVSVFQHRFVPEDQAR